MTFNDNTRLDTGARFSPDFQESFNPDLRQSFAHLSDELYRERMPLFGHQNTMQNAEHDLQEGILDMQNGQLHRGGRELNEAGRSLYHEGRRINGATDALSNVSYDLQSGDGRAASMDLRMAIRELGSDPSNLRDRMQLVQDMVKLRHMDDYDPSVLNSVARSVDRIGDNLEDRGRSIGQALGELRDARGDVWNQNSQGAVQESRQALRDLRGRDDDGRGGGWSEGGGGWSGGAGGSSGGDGSCNNRPQELTDSAAPSSIWGDPHLKAKDGSQAEDQIAAGKDVNLLQTRSGAEIVGQTAKFDNADLAKKDGCNSITVFNKEVVSLNDNQKILFNADGTAYHVDDDGRIGAPLKDGETITSCTNPGDSVTYNACKKTLDYTFSVGDDKVSGSLQGNIDSRGNYINTNIASATGDEFGGMMPAMKTSFNGTTVDARTGAGAFKPDDDGNQRTNQDFYVQSLLG